MDYVQERYAKSVNVVFLHNIVLVIIYSHYYTPYYSP